jgi:hypothetical protein
MAITAASNSRYRYLGQLAQVIQRREGHPISSANGRGCRDFIRPGSFHMA